MSFETKMMTYNYGHQYKVMNDITNKVRTVFQFIYKYY